MSTKATPAPEKRERSLLLPRATRLTVATSSGLEDFQWTMLAVSVLWTEIVPNSGGVASYSTANELDAEFPALSVQPPETFAVETSGPEYVSEVQLAIPDVASAPCQPMPNAWLYQPL